MTAAGRAFLAANTASRKQRLNVSLRGIFIFDFIATALQAAANREIDEAVVLRRLAAVFPRERPQRALRTVVAWARDTELCRYSGTRRGFHSLREFAPPVAPAADNRPGSSQGGATPHGGSSARAP